MRKRKSPIVLVTSLAVIVATVCGLQFAWSRTNGPADTPPAPEVQEVKAIDAPRPASTAASVSASVKQGLNASASAPTGEDAAPMPHGPMGSTILAPGGGSGGKPPKPTPNPSSTSAQWYSKDSSYAAGKG